MGDKQIVWRKSLEEKLGGPYNVFASTEQMLILGAQHGQDFQEQTGSIVALDTSSGDELWRFELEAGRVSRILALVENTVFVCSQDTRTIADADNHLIALDATSGETLWIFPVSAHSLSPASVPGS